MRLLASATMAPPPLLIYRRRRREVILASDGQPRIMAETLTTIEVNVPASVAKAARRAGGWIRHRVTLARIATGTAVIYAKAVAEDIAGAIWNAVAPPVYQFGGAS